MTEGVVLAVLVVGGLLAFVAAPLLRRNPGRTERLSETLSQAREFSSRREMLVEALRDLEDDHATDKIDTADYERLHASLSAQAVDVMRRLDELQSKHAEEIAADSSVVAYRGKNRTDSQT